MVRNNIHCPLLASGAEPDSEVGGIAPCTAHPATRVHTKGFSLVVRKLSTFSFVETLSHPGDWVIEVSPESLKERSK